MMKNEGVFTNNHNFVFVVWGTRRWAGTNYTTSGLGEPIYSNAIHSPTFGVQLYLYKDVKIGDSVTLGGSDERLMNVFAILDN